MSPKNREILVLALTLLSAFGFWYLIFVSTWGVFWIKIALGATLLALVSMVMARDHLPDLFSFRPTHVALGVLSAAVFYGVFWVGKLLLTAIWAGGTGAISSVYTPRAGFPLWAIAALLLLVTGPAEEIFWRGFVLRILTERLGRIPGLLTATGFYAAVHVWTGNAALILAALVVGLGWGWLYQRTNSLVAVMTSHALWGVAIFVIWPLA